MKAVSSQNTTEAQTPAAEKKDERIHDKMSDMIIETAEHLVTTEGAHTLTVRRILQTLGITNRVFYNRFHNMDEVLEIVYRNTVLKIRESLTAEKPENQADFFAHVTDIVANSLIISYKTKMQFSHYVFENDSVSQSNYHWWRDEIKKLIDYAKQQHFIKDIDSDVMSYAIWCFCRGYNADALGRKLPLEEAVRNFRYSFGILLDGMRV